MRKNRVMNVLALEAALEAIGWTWLRDKHGWYRVSVGADDAHGNLETEYFLAVRPEWSNALLFRLYAVPYFAGVPEGVVRAVQFWNVTRAYPKAALLEDEEGDSKLFLEFMVPCWDERIPQTLVNRLLEDFAEGCAAFLQKFAEELCAAPRYRPDPSSGTLH
jgi:hypothetical protein